MTARCRPVPLKDGRVVGSVKPSGPASNGSESKEVQSLSARLLAQTNEMPANLPLPFRAEGVRANSALPDRPAPRDAISQAARRDYCRRDWKLCMHPGIGAWLWSDVGTGSTFAALRFWRGTRCCSACRR
jgi:hypothetical protein